MTTVDKPEWIPYFHGMVSVRPDVWGYKDGLVIQVDSEPSYIMVLHVDAKQGDTIGSTNKVDWFDTLEKAKDAIDLDNGKVWELP